MIHQRSYILLSSVLFFSLNYTSQQPTDELAKQAFKVLGTQANDLINYGKEQYGIISPLQKAQQDNVEAQIELSKKQMGLNQQQETLNEKQIILADKQIEEASLDTHLKKLTIIKETCSMLPKDNPAAIEAIKRSEAYLTEIIKDLPSLPADTTDPKIDDNKKVDDIKTKNSLLTLITASCLTTATKAGEWTDFLAGYSFAYVTNLDCFKNTFIDTHKVKINRGLIVVTIAAITYSAYRLYKAKTHVDNDDDIFNDDYDY